MKLTPLGGCRAMLVAVAAVPLMVACGEVPAGRWIDGGIDDWRYPVPDATSDLASDDGPVVAPETYLVVRSAPLRASADGDARQIKEVLRGSLVRRLMQAPKTNGRIKVAFLAKRGWMLLKRLSLLEPDRRLREVALAHPDAFFKRQVYHRVWNPTGPPTSGNCAPTSLAIAAKVFGKEPPGMQVERSIDRVRKLMGKPSDGGSASLSQLREGASKLKLKWVASTRSTLDQQLNKGRMVVLTGTPGDESNPSRVTRYQQAFRSAGYSYTFSGRHSILVMARLDSGKYLVADPLSTVGTLKLKAAIMSDFTARWGGLGTAVWIKE